MIRLILKAGIGPIKKVTKISKKGKPYQQGYHTGKKKGEKGKFKKKLDGEMSKWKDIDENNLPPEGTKVIIKESVGGGSGTIDSYSPSGKYAIVKTKDGNESVHLSDLQYKKE